MSDRVLIVLPAVGTLVLERTAYEAALAEGARLSAAPAPSPAVTSPKLMSAEDMEGATGVPASWFATQARERRIPFTKLGRYVRFSYEEVITCDRFRRRAIPPGQLCTGSQNRNGVASD